MKLNRSLSPPIAHIERSLFGVSPALIEAVERGEASKAIADSVRSSPEWAEHLTDATVETGETAATESAGKVLEPPMPPHLRELVERRIRATEAMQKLFDPVPTPGQIVEIKKIETPQPGQLDWVMQAPLYVLLDAPGECDTVWHGWLASGEADYAGWWDFVLQEEDGPFEPEAGVVHVWIPLRIYLPMAGRVVAKLQLARLQAVRALAAEYVEGYIPEGAPVWPGRVAVRTTLDGLPVVTGSPLGGDEDPRHRYQHLYFHAADAIRVPARLALAASVAVSSPISALMRRMVEAASRAGQMLAPAPRVARAMSLDLPESDKSRDRLHRLGSAPEGCTGRERSKRGSDLGKRRSHLDPATRRGWQRIPLRQSRGRHPDYL